MIAIGSRYPLLLLLHLPVEKSNWNRLLLISGECCSSFQASAISLKDDVPDCSGGDHGGWKQVFVGLNVYGKDILQKKWLELLISGRNGGSKILPRLYGVATACCVSWQISNPQIWKKHSREICYVIVIIFQFQTEEGIVDFLSLSYFFSFSADPPAAIDWSWKGNLLANSSDMGWSMIMHHDDHIEWWSWTW